MPILYLELLENKTNKHLKNLRKKYLDLALHMIMLQEFICGIKLVLKYLDSHKEIK